MSAKMMIRKLTLVGSRKNYSVSFKEGLNYISGHTSTGKTSILEMIDYALGSKKHKSYIEIGRSCSAVELELLIDGERFLFRRKLFTFAQPVIVELWDTEKEKYTFYARCETDIPSNPKSLSAFLIEKLDLANIDISGDSFSFRDLFKYSYLRQTEIDSENIMQERDWIHNRKRKATFEIIFNLFNEQLASYKSTLKAREEECEELLIQLQGIKDFLASSELADMTGYTQVVKALNSELTILRSDLAEIKRNKGVNTVYADNLRRRIIDLKEESKRLASDKNDQRDYLNKLHLLHNQYESEIEKRQLAKDGYFAFSQYELAFCPNCLKPLQVSKEVQDVCCLCGSEKNEDASELLILEKEIRQIKRKTTELNKFIEVEDKKLDSLINTEKQHWKNLAEAERELQHLYNGYDNPQLEQIELLNYEIGQRMRLQFDLEQKLKMVEELEGIEKRLADKQESLESLRAIIKKLSQTTSDKKDFIQTLTEQFTEVLKAFEFPKLSNSYIDEATYLPYVRGRKYDDIGSLAGVSLITMGYYLAILLEGIEEGYHHLGLLLIDSPRKNLGAKISLEADKEFMDEKIYNALVRYFVRIGTEYEDKLQLIIVNNGYPDFLPPECIVAEFDTERDDLPNGLIDDDTAI